VVNDKINFKKLTETIKAPSIRPVLNVLLISIQTVITVLNDNSKKK